MIQVPMPANVILSFRILIKVIMFDVLDELDEFDWEDYSFIFNFDFHKHRELQSSQLD